MAPVVSCGLRDPFSTSLRGRTFDACHSHHPVIVQMDCGSLWQRFFLRDFCWKLGHRKYWYGKLTIYSWCFVQLCALRILYTCHKSQWHTYSCLRESQYRTWLVSWAWICSHLSKRENKKHVELVDLAGPLIAMKRKL